jgi:carboxyl-terminal processing protease
MRAKFEKTGLIIMGAVLGILLSLNFSAIADKDTKSANTLPIDDLRAFAEVFGKIKSDYVDPVEDKKLLTEAINGMLTGLDPHSTYLDAEAFKELQDTTQGAFGGLGIEVGMEDGLVKVVSPIEDTPAYKAGLKPGDLIMKLDDTLVKGLSLNDAVKLMRGAPDTKIVLTIIRKGEPAPFTVTLTRAVIKVQSVKYKIPEPGYGYARVTQFQEKSSEDLAKAIKEMHDQNKGPFKGFVLDLRNNPGGLLNSAVGISATFLPKNALVVYTEGRSKDSQMRLTANPENYARGADFLNDLPADVKTMPMVVLVNGGSASASEIVSGALQDHKRAVIMGTQTFGKGSVQTILPMNNGAGIKLTTARYFTPNGRSIQAKGIVPDIIVEDPTDQGMTLHEADLSHHLANPKGGEEVTSKTTDSKDKDKNKDADKEAAKAERQAPVEPASKNDYQFNQAMNLLKGLQIMQNNK